MMKRDGDQEGWKPVTINTIDQEADVADNIKENQRAFDKLDPESYLEFLQICRNYGKLGKD
jgi:hypothetical protein